MNDQVNHLQQLVEQREKLTSDLEALTTQTSRTRELALKTQGAIEYLEAVGVKLPEPEAEEKAEAAETEVVVPEEG